MNISLMQVALLLGFLIVGGVVTSRLDRDRALILGYVMAVSAKVEETRTPFSVAAALLVYCGVCYGVWAVREWDE